MKMQLTLVAALSLFTGLDAQAQIVPTGTGAAAPLTTSSLSSQGQGSHEIKISRSGTQASTKGPAQNFTGDVTVTPLFAAPEPARAYGGRVTFQPGARTAWHTHPLGQTLIVTEGTGLVQRLGGPVEEIRTGDVVWIPPGQKHWHGATASESMTHIAIVERLDGKSADWMEQVGDQEYAAPVQKEQARVQPATSTTGTSEPTRAQQLVGNFAPKLGQLTDDVLFGDVWKRPELSPRDRSLVTVSALIAMNRPDQLRSHLARARDNGVTEQELGEAMTHLAFYAGWPNALSAVTVAREVFEKKPMPGQSESPSAR